MKRIRFFFLHKMPNYMYLIFSITFFLIYYFSFQMLFGFLSLFFILILFFRYFLLRPISIIKPKEKISVGKILTRKTSNQIVLFLDEEYIQKVNKKSNFSSCLWDSVWLNTLEQEVGSFSVCTNMKKLLKNLKKYKVLILGRTDKITSEVIRKFNEYVNSGGLILLNFPQDRNICHFAGITSIKTTKHLSSIFLVKRRIPSFTKLLVVELEKNTKILLKNDNLPLIISKKNGKGEVITLLFDFGLFLISLQQGKPDENFNVVNHNKGLYNLDTPDLVSSEKLLSNFIPYADILERYIINLIEEEKPIIRSWYFPPKYNSAVILSHDEEAIGDGAINIVNIEKTTSSYAIVPYSPISKNTIKKMEGIGIDIGIHWIRLNRKFLIFNRRDSLNNQIKKLKNKNIRKIIFNRTHHLDWGNDFVLPFKILCSNKIKIDSSYGPNPKIDELYGFSAPNLKGYLFGTGLPFIPLDKNGLPFKIYEIPFQFQENFGNVKLKDMKKIINESIEKYYQITTVNYHPIFLEKSKLYHQYFLEISRPKQIWKTNFKKFYNWWLKRSSIKISKLGKKFVIKTPFKFRFFMRDTPFLNIDKKKTKGKPFKINDLKYHYFIISEGRHTVKLI